MENLILVLLIGSITLNVLLLLRLADIKLRAKRAMKWIDATTMTAESINLVADLAGHPNTRARDPIGFRRRVVVEHEGITEVFVPLRKTPE